VLVEVMEFRGAELRPALARVRVHCSSGTAWLPGTEGGGVADVLFGARPTGKLSFAWPRSMAAYPRAKNSDPLFPLGFGLSY
jgi:hypothetical protein